MRLLSLQTLRQIDDGDGFEWALLDTNAAANAEGLRDEGDLGGGRDLDAELAQPHHWALPTALLIAFLWFTFLTFYNSNTC